MVPPLKHGVPKEGKPKSNGFVPVLLAAETVTATFPGLEIVKNCDAPKNPISWLPKLRLLGLTFSTPVGGAAVATPVRLTVM